MNMDKTFQKRLLTLTDADITSRRCISRRSVLSVLGLGLGAAAAAVAGRALPASAQSTPESCTDTDSGQYEDPPGMGRRCDPGARRGPTGPRPPRATRPTGCTDIDRGPSEDPQGYGVRCEIWI
jgi:hypothetical protein